MDLIITPLFVGILILLQIPFTFLVGVRRLKTNIMLLDGGDETLTRRMRAHGNFTETVPITLIAMAMAEMGGAPSLALWLGGSFLLVGRITHAATLLTNPKGNGRAIGMVLTVLAMAILGYFALASFHTA